MFEDYDVKKIAVVFVVALIIASVALVVFLQIPIIPEPPANSDITPPGNNDQNPAGDNEVTPPVDNDDPEPEDELPLYEGDNVTTDDSVTDPALDGLVTEPDMGDGGDEPEETPDVPVDDPATDVPLE
ncbi:MAG: hypothetical protein CL943_01985 [Candidatus Diapherotrites archaeon]|uniref:Uncharacterized protein n=1 Tax=Candidatus Iainarchaeum sp. TaxID=3101447 RepID=A0A2D6M0V4_9ARCH|nr:hypothetical protein [Candidatus Diapherotrites archaeon]|tara:strand:+ start:5965 stop:6348 length:384 start_codon:yes stop_codon:yes gene_type:complete